MTVKEMTKLCIIGGGGYGKTVADIAKLQNKYDEIIFLDDGETEECAGFPVVGKVNDFVKHIDDSDFTVAIGDNGVRKKIIEKILSSNGVMATLIHPQSVIASDAQIADGCVIMAGVVVNPSVEIGVGTILNTCCSVDHDNIIGKYCHIAVGAHLAGTVKVGEETFIGAGAIVKNNITVCSRALIGAGAVVVKDITEEGTYIGVPARKKEEK